MSEAIQKIGFGAINDTDESLKGKSGGGVFGLNEAVNITVLEYNGNAGKDGAEADAVDITVTVGDREMRRRIYNVTRVFDNKNNELTDPNSQEYIKIYNANMSQAMAVVVHALKAVGVTQEQINAALATPPADFKGWAQIVTALKPADFATRPVDAFLEYQWVISDDQDRTFLEVPKNMKGGRFLAPALAPVGEWKEEREWVETKQDGTSQNIKGLRYVDTAGNVHPFTRNQNYMESNKAIQQTEGQAAVTGISQAGNGAAPTGAPKSTWG